MSLSQQVNKREVLKGARPKKQEETKYDPGVPKPEVVDLSSTFLVSPFILHTAKGWKKPEGFDEMSEEDTVRALLEHEDNIVLGVGKLNLRTLNRFSRRFKCDIERYVMRLFSVGAYDSLGPDVVTDVTYDEENDCYRTSYGTLRGTGQEAAIDLVSFLLSAYGQIVAVDPESEYGYEFAPIDEETIQDLLDSRMFSSLDSEDETTPFAKLLERTHTFIRSKAVESETERAEQEKMEEKKSPTASSENEDASRS